MGRRLSRRRSGPPRGNGALGTDPSCKSIGPISSNPPNELENPQVFIRHFPLALPNRMQPSATFGVPASPLSSSKLSERLLDPLIAEHFELLPVCVVEPFGALVVGAHELEEED